MITLLNTGVATLGVVDLPEGATKITVSLLSHNLAWHSEEKNTWAYKYGMLSRTEIKLPPGNWIILGWSDEIEFKQKFEILDKQHVAGPMWTYKMYDDSGYYSGYIDVSWNSLLSANGITQRKLILKQVI